MEEKNIKIATKDLKPGDWFVKPLDGGVKSWLIKKDFIVNQQEINALLASGISFVEIKIKSNANKIELKEKEEKNELIKENKKDEINNKEKSEISNKNINIIENKVLMEEELKNAQLLCDKAKEAVEGMFKEARLGKAIETESVIPLIEEINNSISRHPDALISVARLKTHDEYTYLHSVAVAGFMTSLAKKLELPEHTAFSSALGGMMHDIGKAKMPLKVLNKPGALTDEEYFIMKNHPKEGWKILKEKNERNEDVLDIVLHHHEKVDGSGYPDKLKNEEISMLAKMGAICDVYDAVTSNRPYKNPWTPAESLQRMMNWQGHFDQNLLKAFIKCVGIYPVGSLVRLESKRLGVVVEQNQESLLKPIVKVFFNARKNETLYVKEINLADVNCNDRIVGIESNNKWKFPNIEKLWMNR